MYEAVLDCVPDVIEVVEETGELHSTLVPIAVCPERDRALVVQCRLAGTSNATARFHEFSFSILVVDRSGIEEPFETQDRDIARRYLPAGVIPLVMPIVLRSLEVLIDRVRPEILYRVTKLRDPTPAALKKHDLVTRSLMDSGYEVRREGRDRFGRGFWEMTRSR